MKTAHNPGFASRLWTILTSGIRKHSTGVGWKHLPQELVDEVLGYFADDPGTLLACSLTCKYLFVATRPLIHQWLVCVDARPTSHGQDGHLFSRRTGTFAEQLIDADRSGTIRYTRHLTFKAKHPKSSPYFTPEDMQACILHLRSITKLHSLTLIKFHVVPFIPVFNQHFGMFTNTLRHLDIRRAGGVDRDLLYIISQFPLLEDLTIVSPAGALVPPHGYTLPTITQSPPLQGRLILARVVTGELSNGLAAFPGGLNFRSLELTSCGRPQAILAACGHATTSISYLWQCGNGRMPALDLGPNAVLERFEFTVAITELLLAYSWIYWTLHSITSPVFNEFAVWFLNTGPPPTPTDGTRWDALDWFLSKVMTERNPDFRVVVMGYADWSLVQTYLPLCVKRGWGRAASPQAENRFRRLGVLCIHED